MPGSHKYDSIILFNNTSARLCLPQMWVSVNWEATLNIKSEKPYLSIESAPKSIAFQPEVLMAQ